MNKEYICKYCGKVCKNKNSLVQHEIRCNKNPNKIDTSKCFGINSQKGHVAWNKGLTKYDDPRIAKYGTTYKENYKNGKFKIWCTGLNKGTDERINKLSNTVKQTVNNKISCDNWHVSFSKTRTQIYNI